MNYLSNNKKPPIFMTSGFFILAIKKKHSNVSDILLCYFSIFIILIVSIPDGVSTLISSPTSRP